MADMLVSLLSIPCDNLEVDRLKDSGIVIRRIQTYEMSLLRAFVADAFSGVWADEVMAAFAHQPPTCYVATHEKRIVGFAAYECTCRDYFGPTGVLETYRGKGIGKALCLASLRALRELGYAYAIIGSAGPTDFYEKCCGATSIPDSDPGIYADMLTSGE